MIDAAGIITCAEKGRLYQCKGNGLVRDVFSASSLHQLKGYMGVSHVRYPTAGTSSNAEAQPFYVNSPYGIALAHNGNLTNAATLRAFLDHDAHRHINTDSDSELLLNFFAYHLQKTGKIRIDENDIFDAISQLYMECRGGYACVALLAGYGMIAFRDPFGIRPCIYGYKEGYHGKEWMITSESVALDALEFTVVTDLLPGEALIITKEQQLYKRQLIDPPRTFTPCLFEYVYFARPDSILDGVSVYQARLAMGKALALQVQKTLGVVNDIDVVIPVPDTARCSALETSFILQKPYREGFNKNRYIGRTFIMPGQSLRAKSVRRKLNAIALEFANKNVLIVDDSIVRGTTSKEIILMAREAGAKKVYFASCAPAIRFPNVYGIDMPTTSELVAHDRTDQEIAERIGADCVIYLELEALENCVRQLNPKLIHFDNSVFTGQYITGDITPSYLNELASARQNIQGSMNINRDSIGLYNQFKDG
ncbi:amidophosphoribosyltransferase [Coelomomyces lativittatus]|nr:amidophosphoribosyltransferase [Coelomomyces lativittatus]